MMHDIRNPDERKIYSTFVTVASQSRTTRHDINCTRLVSFASNLRLTLLGCPMKFFIDNLPVCIVDTIEEL